MQELSFAFFEERDNATEVRRQFLRSPVILADIRATERAQNQEPRK